MKTVFHKGELAMQAESGIQERMHKVGNAVIRDHIIEQHKEFFENLQYVFIALQDNDSRPWVTLMQGAPGFINSPDDRTLNLSGKLIGEEQLDLNLGQRQAIGLLGLDLSNRRRNRLNGYLNTAGSHDKLSIEVGHSYGNCPKYIQIRNFDQGSEPTDRQGLVATHFSTFDSKISGLIEHSDTLFIASAEKANGDLDASHRGGKPGFVRVSSQTELWFNDYPGNNLYQTFGNVHGYSTVGLMFLDFEAGDLILLSGKAHIETLEKQSQDSKFLPRRFHFSLEKGVRIERAVNGTWALEEVSPFLTKELD